MNYVSIIPVWLCVNLLFYGYVLDQFMVKFEVVYIVVVFCLFDEIQFLFGE